MTGAFSFGRVWVGQEMGRRLNEEPNVSFAANVLKVFIASPGDVADERRIIREIVSEWNYVHAEDRQLVLLPVGWETHSTPTMGERPQAIINKQVLENCDLLIAVFWTRLGSPTGQAASGTVEEIEEHLAAGKPAMLYFSDAPVRLDSVDEGQYQALRAFKKECYDRGLVESYDSLEVFKEKLSRQLAQAVIREFAELRLAEPGDAPANEPRLVRDILTDDAKQLLRAAAEDDGNISVIETRGGSYVQAGGRDFVEPKTPREAARWKSALEELLNQGLAAPRGHKGVVFDITHRGHQVAGELREAGNVQEDDGSGA